MTAMNWGKAKRRPLDRSLEKTREHPATRWIRARELREYSEKLREHIRRKNEEFLATRIRPLKLEHDTELGMDVVSDPAGGAYGQVPPGMVVGSIAYLEWCRAHRPPRKTQKEKEEERRSEKARARQAYLRSIVNGEHIKKKKKKHKQKRGNDVHQARLREREKELYRTGKANIF